MIKEDLRFINVGQFVANIENDTNFTVVYKDKNGFVTNDGIYHFGDNLSKFVVGNVANFYFYTTQEENEKCIDNCGGVNIFNHRGR